MNKTSIEWTHRPQTGAAKGGFTWNPIRARTGEVDHRTGSSLRTGTFCTRISPGCLNCYASAINKRFGTGAEYTVPNLAKHEFYTDPRIIEEPLQRRTPATIFVGDMFDLFHEAIGDDLIQDVVRVMEVAKHHTFQVLTKRTRRMMEFFMRRNKNNPHLWPAENVWLGTSIESQKFSEERIQLLQGTPARVRFLSIEPLLEFLTFTPQNEHIHKEFRAETNCGARLKPVELVGIDWVICGGESGPGARPFNLAWAEKLLIECRAAGVPFFMKQLGSRPRCYSDVMKAEIYWKACTDRKGGNPSEWPEHLRVREFPA